MAFHEARPDTDSSSSSLNPSHEDLPMAVSPLDQSVKPPSFDSIHAPDMHSTPSSLSPSPTTSESLLPSPTPSPTISLPGYSDSLPVPEYRPNPTGGEQRLEFNPLRSIYGRSTGVWLKRIKDMTISLYNQDPVEVQRVPRYGKRGIITGTIDFDEENLAMFEKVKLVIEGQISIDTSTYEGRSEVFVRKSFTLWRKLENSALCPHVINFQIPFSAIESRGVGTEQLPPSYACDMGQGRKISCSYSIHINVTQKSKHAFWTNRNRHVIPINYVPRSRPPHAFPRDLVLPRSTIKAGPEAWRQIITAQGAMSCNLFIPSVSAFCVTDEIPFFLQLVAPAGYLNLKEGEEPTLQVSLQRQVGVSIQEIFIRRDTISSQGVVKSLPSGTIPQPSLATLASEAGVSSNSSGESILTRGFKKNRNVKGTRGDRIENGETKTWEWQGTVCNGRVKAGGCTTEVMVINDFFVFSVRIKRSSGHTMEYHHAQPIDMVSETI
ncbi:hypothetical protein BDM02DRAFT_3262020 [Thelephora ganbajun]|uniref:Uncharacterized protein n=1 Tax=Thelephora ganbajun TaxID=370292 RepID=A0ACB6ZB19_THEGA|nr:hypothetical protein BDM02DRAFT_3262020 [Thelephora ganbajun]